jgi:hypothetical protein
MRRTLSAFLLASAVVAPASAASLSVPMDEVRVITFAKPVATVYVGNPVVADVNMIDTRRAFILGKSFGATNIIALDANGAQISNNLVTVLGRTASTVTLNKGGAQTTLTCAGRCEATPTPGDGKDNFSASADQMDKHMDAAKRAASNQ